MSTVEHRAPSCICAAILVGLVICTIVGCAQPISVRVVDSSSGAPIAGARVTRREVVCPPLWVVGWVVPAEECMTGNDGCAHLKDCEGSIHVDADGFVSDALGGLDQDGEDVVISLERVDEKSQHPDDSGN